LQAVVVVVLDMLAAVELEDYYAGRAFRFLELPLSIFLLVLAHQHLLESLETTSH
jgi:hypothetical protein